MEKLKYKEIVDTVKFYELNFLIKAINELQDEVKELKKSAKTPYQLDVEHKTNLRTLYGDEVVTEVTESSDKFIDKYNPSYEIVGDEHKSRIYIPLLGIDIPLSTEKFLLNYYRNEDVDIKSHLKNNNVSYKISNWYPSKIFDVKLD